MIPRAAFFCITVFWAAMNFFLWRDEYGSPGGEMPVPADLIWQKILTAPDASSLSIFQNGKRTGFCEFSTSMEREMAKLDEDNPPPAGLVTRAGYRIRLTGNAGFGEFTNRARFECRLQFFPNRDWREMNLKIFIRDTSVEIHSTATNQTVHLKITDGASVMERNFTFADLQNPTALLRAFAGGFGGGFFGQFELPIVPQNTAALTHNLHWQASRKRMNIGGEPTSVYCLETELLQNRIVIYVSTLGEILRVELPGGILVTLDEWSKP